MSRLNDGLPDRKYYNVAMANNESANSYTLAFYKDNFNQQILKDPSKYYLSILRFQVPTADIPILIPEIQSFPNTDVNKTVYNVTLNWNGFTSGQVDVIFDTSFPNETPRAITATDPNPMKDPSVYYFIYDYRHFIRIVNDAFKTAYTLLNIAAGGIIVSSAPYITYNGTTYLMTLHCPPEYLGTAVNPIEIFMNYKLSTFFGGTETLFYDFQSNLGVKYEVIDYDGANFVGGQYLMAQQYPTLSQWNIFKSLQIASSFLPVENEIVPVPSYLQQGVYNTLSIVKDFVPFYENGPEARSFINFRYNGAYELIDLNSNSSISTIDVAVYWLDRYGNRYILSIPYNQVLTIKFVFIKKDTFTG